MYFWRELTVVEILGIAATIIAVIGIILALLTPRGREAFALLGLRVADALVRWLEDRLGPTQRGARALRRSNE